MEVKVGLELQEPVTYVLVLFLIYSRSIRFTLIFYVVYDRYCMRTLEAVFSRNPFRSKSLLFDPR